MSIVPQCRLSAGDLKRLGNNLAGPGRSLSRSRLRRDQLAAVNRSLSIVGEHVTRLYRPCFRRLLP